jgi:hypothetical protein
MRSNESHHPQNQNTAFHHPNFPTTKEMILPLLLKIGTAAANLKVGKKILGKHSYFTKFVGCRFNILSICV